ncbi:hypothetical protein BGZ60DRAFT_568402 [Tricladium varicosporioides]|nr:hypothetical protein BGZ60DRAFT_568402 [Hymenoscyphus varicosporioides]
MYPNKVYGFAVGCLLLPWSGVTAAPFVSNSTLTSITSQNVTSSITLTTITPTEALSSALSTPIPTLSDSTSLYIQPNSTTQSKVISTSYPTESGFGNQTISPSARYTFANRTSSSSGPTPAPAVLIPANPPGINPLDPIVLQPNQSVSLFFQQPAASNSSDVAVASVSIPKMAYPAVVLDHSQLISEVICDENTLQMKFLHSSALGVAERSWTMPKFIMMAFHDKCGRAIETGERDYLLVHGLQFDRSKLSADLKISHIGVAEAVGAQNPITVDMGSYTPSSLNGTNGFDTTTAPVTPGNATTANSTTSAKDFDVALDDEIGYTTFSTTPNIKRFLDIDASSRIVIRSWCGFCDKVVKAVKTVVKAVETFLPSWTLTPLNKNIDVNLGGGNIYTPWGKKGYQLYSKSTGSNYLRLYCVDCGVNGVVNIKATVTFNVLGVIESGSFSANGWLGAGLGLGVDANYVGSIPAFSTNIVAIPLSPFAIPGLITIGPHLDLGVGANAGVSANGRVYAGVRLNWPAIHAQLNLYSAPSASGWIPTVSTNFDAQGTVYLGADAYVTVTLGFGVSILNGLKSFGVSLVEKPDLYITGTSSSPSCHGIEVKAGFTNYVYADVFGSHHSINTWNGPSAAHCVYIKKKRDVLTLPSPPRGKALGSRSLNNTVSAGVTSKKQIQTADGTIGLHYADNGNLYALPQGNGTIVDMSTIWFTTTNDSVLTGDAGGRIFHGYTDTLSNVGISRLRLSRLDHVPKTAVALSFQPTATTVDDTQGALMIVDAARNAYYPVVCTFGDQDFPKVFIVKESVEGVKRLMDEAYISTITGVKPDACGVIPLIAI